MLRKHAFPSVACAAITVGLALWAGPAAATEPESESGATGTVDTRTHTPHETGRPVDIHTVNDLPWT